MSEENKFEEKVEETVEEVKEEATTAVDQLEAESKEAMDRMNSEGNEAVDEITKALNDAKDSVTKIIGDVSNWVNDNVDQESIQENIEKAKVETGKIFNSIKDKFNELAANENVRSTMQSGKDFVKSGTERLKDNENVRSIFEKGTETIDSLRSNEALKNAVDKAEDFSKNTNDAFWSGVKKFFDKPVEPQDVIETEITEIEDIKDTDDTAGEE